MNPRIWLASLLVLTACSANLAVPTTATIGCQTSTDCLSDQVCVVDRGQCVAPGTACIAEANVGYRSLPDGNPCSTPRISADEGICLEGACVATLCGDDFVNTANEICDTGAALSDTLPNACRTNCTPARCGDGVVDDLEVCDDNNNDNGDGCTSDCRQIEICGAVLLGGVLQEAVVDVGETCDDNNNDPNDGCDACQLTQWRADVLIGAVPGNSRQLSIAASSLAVLPQGGLVISERQGTVGRLWRLDPTAQALVAMAGNGTEGTPVVGGPAALSPLPQVGSVNNGPSTTYHPPYVAAARDGSTVMAIGSKLWRVDADGSLHHLAGSGATCSAGTCGDGGLATAAQLTLPLGVAVDRNGDTYVVDRQAYRVRKITRTGVISTVAGSQSSCGVPTGGCGDGSSATNATLYIPNSVAVADNGALYIADTGTYRIRRVQGGTISTVVGTGNYCSGTCALTGLGTTTNIGSPLHLAVHNDTLYFSISGERRLRQLTLSTGEIDVALGDGAACSSFVACGDGGVASMAQTNAIEGIATSAAGEVFVSSAGRVRRIFNGVVTTVAGSGEERPNPNGLHAWSTPRLQYAPVFRAVSQRAGQLVLGEGQWHRLMGLDPKTLLYTHLAGNDVLCSSGACGDAGPAIHASLNAVTDVAAGPNGALYLVDSGLSRLRRINANGTLDHVAGNGVYCAASNPCGNGEQAVDAQFAYMAGVVVASNGDIYLADSARYNIRRIDGATQVISTFAGTGDTCPALPCGDGANKSLATFHSPTALALDADENLYVGDWRRVRRIDRVTGTVTTVAGNGSACTTATCGDGVAPTSAQIDSVGGLAFTAAGDLLFTDSGEYKVRRVRLASDGVIETLAGNGSYCSSTASSCGDGGLAVNAPFNFPSRLTEITPNVVVVVDSLWVRRFTIGGNIERLASALLPATGSFDVSALGEPGHVLNVGDAVLISDGPAGRILRADTNTDILDLALGFANIGLGDLTQTSVSTRYAALLGNAQGMALGQSAQGISQIYFADASRHVIGVITAPNINDVSTWTAALFAGTPDTPGDDDGDVLAATFNGPAALTWDAAARKLYVAESLGHTVRVIDDGTVETLAGTSGWPGYFGDSGPATQALLNTPSGLALANDGSLYIADTGNHRVRRFNITAGTLSTVLGDGSSGSGGGVGVGQSISARTPVGLAVDARGNLFVSSHNLVRVLVAGADGLATGLDTSFPIYGGGTAYPNNLTACLSGLALRQGGSELFVVDRCAGLALRLERGGL